MSINSFILVAVTVLACASCKYQNDKSRRENFQRHVGTYILDIRKTDMGAYRTDSGLYKDIKIYFLPDSTFFLSKSVPFLYDSAGTWTAAGSEIDDWNYLHFGGRPGVDIPFDVCCDADSTFYLNSVTPRPNKPAISVIYFKRINL